MEKYLTTKELATQIKMKPGTIRNLVWQGEFKRNLHYVKPTEGKILFIWSAVEAWLYGRPAQRPAISYKPKRNKTDNLIS